MNSEFVANFNSAIFLFLLNVDKPGNDKNYNADVDDFFYNKGNNRFLWMELIVLKKIQWDV